MMRLKTLSAILLLSVFSPKLFSQNISGNVTAQTSREPLISAIVYDSLSGKGALTNEHGYFTLSLSQKKVALRISYIGYNSQVLIVDLARDTFVKIALEENDALQTVEVTANSYEKNAGNGLINLPIEKLNKVPSIGGERDILKALTILPGVSGGDEGAASLIVRGGSNDQNMIILDGTPIYNTGHLFNFVSLFNADAVKKIDFYKSYFPARFGGRLSSVLDINFREGNKNRFEGKVDVGIISSKVLFEGPLSKNRKTSFLFAARSSYLDLFTIGKEKKVLAKDPTYDLFGSSGGKDFLGYTFADINLKINHQFNEKNKLFFNVYLGQDVFRTAQGSTTETNQQKSTLLNTAIALRSYHVLSPRFFLQWGVSYSENRGNFKTEDKSFTLIATPPPPNTILPEKYSFKLNNIQNAESQGLIKDVTLNMKGDYVFNSKNTLHIGTDITQHFYQPNQNLIINQDLKDSSKTVKDTLSYYPNKSLNALEFGVFIEDEITINKNWQCFAGLRLSAFNYNKTYVNLEPRLSVVYKLPNKFGALNTAITKTAQYNHALIQTGQIVDRTVWVPSTEKIPPQYAWQYGVSWRKTDEKRGFDVSIEAFCKQMSNLSSFQIKYNDPSIYNNWEQKVLTSGKGESYGLEFFAAKNKGRWQGTAAYTLSWNNRQFEQLNDGRPFPFIYDRRNNLVLTASRDLGKHWKFSSLFTIANGRRFNIPVAKVNETPFSPEYYIYDNLNNGQLPIYHRLDVSFIYEKQLKKKHIWGINFNLYNAYFHQNAYYLYPTVERVYSGTKVVSERDVIRVVSLFPILPSVNFSYKF
jgi:CarboxypepD_reg-like domain/TonB-dependent Receptor Plug Domain